MIIANVAVQSQLAGNERQSYYTCLPRYSKASTCNLSLLRGHVCDHEVRDDLTPPFGQRAGSLPGCWVSPNSTNSLAPTRAQLSVCRPSIRCFFPGIWNQGQASDRLPSVLSQAQVLDKKAKQEALCSSHLTTSHGITPSARLSPAEGGCSSVPRWSALHAHWSKCTGGFVLGPQRCAEDGDGEEVEWMLLEQHRSGIESADPRW